MELISIENSRLLSLFLARRLAGQLYMPDACHAFVERYRFASFPATIEQMTAEPITFGHGVFGDATISELSIFNDGVLIAAASPTDNLDSFLADVMKWSKSTLGLDRIETHAVSKMYESHVLFRTDRDILAPLGVFGDLCRQVSSGIKKATGQDAKFETFGFFLSADHAIGPGLKPVTFRIERKATLEFSMGYYVSSAPLRTKDHVAILQKLDALSPALSA